MPHIQHIATYWLQLAETTQKELLKELVYAHRGGTNFNSMLLRLATKADIVNANKLFKEYPQLVACAHAFANELVDYEYWQYIERETLEPTEST